MKQLYLFMLSDLLENFKDYINEIARQKFGNVPRFVVLNNISTVEKIGRKGLQLVKAQFHSELGNIDLAIAIKEFDSPEEALKNTELTNLISNRLKPNSPEEKKYLNVSTPRVLLQHDTTLIYEGIQGASFTESELDYFHKLQLAGIALSKFHSSETKSASPKRYIHILKSVLGDLPIPTERRNKYFDKAATMLESSVELINSGTAGFGDFHQENIMFSEEISGKSVKAWLIDPEFAEDEKARVDRMEDIGTFFLHTAINYYTKENSLKRLKNDLQYFFKGYNSYLRIYKLSLDKIYTSKHEKSFLFHLGLNALLEALFTVSKGSKDQIDDQITLERISLCLMLANHSWTKGFE
jgi:hypothetical protein